MFYRICLLGCLLTGAISCNNEVPSQVIVRQLRCEYLENPEGIDARHPRLSWQLLSDRRGVTQTGYQVLVSSDSTALVNDEADIWDSKKTRSAQSVLVPFAGASLQSGKKYFWKIRIWDTEENRSAWSPIASWSMGLLNASDWKAQWIGAPPVSVPIEKQYHIHSGYRSAPNTSAETNSNITVDLGEKKIFDTIKLYPSLLGAALKQYLFPVQFSIQIADDSGFSSAKTILNHSNEDFRLPDTKPIVVQTPRTSARYIRINVTKLPHVDEQQFAYSLGELEVLDNKHQNLALRAKVVASDPYLVYPRFTNEKWWPELLTDGFIKPNFYHKEHSLPTPPSEQFRKDFSVDKAIKRATLYATSLGYYEMTINGRKVGNQVLAPEWTDYHKRVQYQTYDVTGLVQPDENTLGAMLADGWYAGAVFSHPERGSYGFDRKLLAQLQIEYANGQSDTIVTDGSWKLNPDGPIISASIFDGEKYDARVVLPGWDSPGFDATAWQAATVYHDTNRQLSAQMNEPIRVIQDITPIKIIPQKNGNYIFDLGQNIAGWVQLSLPYNPGKAITLKHSEMLDEKGALYTSNLRLAKQTDTYIPGKETSIQYEPRFTYHGFRYVEVSGLSKAPELSNITGRVIASAAPAAGTFECSSPDLNKLWQNIVWTQRGNMHSVLTDCPQRDERAGWMGDAQVFSHTSIFNLNMAAFYTKWIRDMRDSQTDAGFFPDFTPQVAHWAGWFNSPGWSDAGVIIPWRMYEHYGDTSILSVQYDAMKKYINAIVRYNPDLLWLNARGNIYGDWLNGNSIVEQDYPTRGGSVPHEVSGTAFFYYSTTLIAKTAHLLNRPDDAARFDSLANAIKAAFINAYMNEDGLIEGHTQAGYAMALDFGLAPKHLEQKVASHMVDAVKRYDTRISTGIQTTIRLMNQLTKYGYSDIAYQLVESRRFPSWIYSIDQGATTIWERWDGYVAGRGFQTPDMNSFNHYAIGAVGEWLYRTVLGINPDPEVPGYKHFFIEPIPGGSVSHAKGSYASIAGNIEVAWKKEDNSFYLDLTVPANTTATVVLPGKLVTENGNAIDAVQQIKLITTENNKTTLSVVSGKYRFESK